jgi:uncharacterized protein
VPSASCKVTHGTVCSVVLHKLGRIEQGWRRRSLLWLRGVRRTGKTTLAKSLPGIEYFDCELPRVRRAMEDPEAFWRSLSGKRVVADEVHRVPNPSELLKVRRPKGSVLYA